MKMQDFLQKKDSNRMGPMTFGRLLESHRKCEELTQEELGKMLGICRVELRVYFTSQESRPVSNFAVTLEISTV